MLITCINLCFVGARGCSAAPRMPSDRPRHRSGSPDGRPEVRTVHLNIDSLPARESGGQRRPFPPVAVLGRPWESSRGRGSGRGGFRRDAPGEPDLDRYPLYFHGKLGTPEDSMSSVAGIRRGACTTSATKSKVRPRISPTASWRGPSPISAAVGRYTTGTTPSWSTRRETRDHGPRVVGPGL